MPDTELAEWYRALWAAAPVVRQGAWSRRDVTGWPGDQSADSLLAWTWTSGDALRMVVINLGDGDARGIVHVGHAPAAGRRWLLDDLIDGTTYDRDGDELADAGLYVARPGWGVHVFEASPRDRRRATVTAEGERLSEARAGGWRQWGPYLSERQWGTVREDYSENGDAWNYFTHDQARSRAYRWGEDGLAGVSDDRGLMCFALSLWNGVDPILKERLFGLTNTEGNHGEDVKEYYFYVDNVPTHSWMRWRYKYPQTEFPYDDLVSTNRERGFEDREYELLDTGVFDDGRYFDIQVDYAKGGPTDLLARITVAQSEQRGGADPLAPDPVVPQHVVAGASSRRSPRCVRVDAADPVRRSPARSSR